VSLRLGQAVFAFAIVAIGVETVVNAHIAGNSLGAQYRVIPTIPWVPAIPALAYLFGVVWVVCGLALLSRDTRRVAALSLGILFVACAFVLDLPKYLPHPASVSLRTIFFEPLAIGALAWLLLGPRDVPAALHAVARYLLGISLIVFGIDHFLAFAFIAALIPDWVPLHAFWTAFFGVAFIAGGLSIALNVLSRWGAAGIALMFGIWVVTLHLPRTLGAYGIPGAIHDPNEWSSLFIALALCGGAWALAETIRTWARPHSNVA
jgi:uncharacterized membrane protein